MYMRGLADASEYDAFGDYVPTSDAPMQAAPDTSYNYSDMTTTQSNGGAPISSGMTYAVPSDWSSLLKQAVATYGVVKSADAARTVAQNPGYRYPGSYPSAGYSPFPSVAGSPFMGLSPLLLLAGAFLLLRR